MVPKEILVVLTASAQNSALAASELLAKHWNVHITALYASRLPEPLDGEAYYASDLWARMVTQAREASVAEREKIERRLARMEAPTELRAAEVM